MPPSTRSGWINVSIFAHPCRLTATRKRMNKVHLVQLYHGSRLRYGILTGCAATSPSLYDRDEKYPPGTAEQKERQWQRVGTAYCRWKTTTTVTSRSRDYNSEITTLVYEGTVNCCIKHIQIFGLWVYETIPTYCG